MIELWRKIPGYESSYEASNLGRIKSNLGLKDRIMKQSLKKMGYFHVDLYKKGVPYTTSVHRIVALTFIENKEEKEQVNHKNGVKTDNRVENLEWCSREENIKHAFINKLNHRGERIRQSILKEHQVKEIRAKYKPPTGHYGNGRSQRSLAKEYGVNQGTIWNILNNKTWCHVT